jgi:S1-C subfamily serine protease
VAEILRQPPIDQGTFDKKKDLEIWPYPENVGLVIDRDSGLGVLEVKPDSAAAKVGLQKGDILGAAGSRRLFSQADFRGVLHRGPRGDGTIEIYWRRGESVMKGILALKAGWRTTDLEWRESVANGNIGANPGMAGANVITDKERERYGIKANTMALQPWFNRDRTYLAQRAGVAGADVIVAVNGESPNLGGRSFLVWFRQKFDPGDKVTLKLKDSKGREREVTYEVRATGR